MTDTAAFLEARDALELALLDFEGGICGLETIAEASESIGTLESIVNKRGAIRSIAPMDGVCVLFVRRLCTIFTDELYMATLNFAREAAKHVEGLSETDAEFPHREVTP